MESDRVPSHNCLNCGVYLDHMSLPDGSGRRPSPGDYTVCFRCGAVMKVAADLTARPLTGKEKNELLADQETLHEIATPIHCLRLRELQEAHEKAVRN